MVSNAVLRGIKVCIVVFVRTSSVLVLPSVFPLCAGAGHQPRGRIPDCSDRLNHADQRLRLPRVLAAGGEHLPGRDHRADLCLSSHTGEPESHLALFFCQ